MVNQTWQLNLTQDLKPPVFPVCQTLLSEAEKNVSTHNNTQKTPKLVLRSLTVGRTCYRVLTETVSASVAPVNQLFRL